MDDLILHFGFMFFILLIIGSILAFIIIHYEKRKNNVVQNNSGNNDASKNEYMTFMDIDKRACHATEMAIKSYFKQRGQFDIDSFNKLKFLFVKRKSYLPTDEYSYYVGYYDRETKILFMSILDLNSSTLELHLFNSIEVINYEKQDLSFSLEEFMSQKI